MKLAGWICAAMFWLPVSPAAAERELLSIRGIVLPEKGYVAGFKIETWGVEVVAVCRFPPGWTITAGKSADPTGILSGEASLGVTWINDERLGELTGLFLVEVYDYHEVEQRTGNKVNPATFKGTYLTGTYGHDPLDWHDVPLKPANLIREPASRCP